MSIVSKSIECPRCKGHGYLIREWKSYVPPTDQQANSDLSDLDLINCPVCSGWGLIKTRPPKVKS